MILFVFPLSRLKSPRFLLRYPASSLPTARLRQLPTAATRSGRFLRHRRRSHRSHTEVPRRLFAYFLIGEKVGLRSKSICSTPYTPPVSLRSTTSPQGEAFGELRIATGGYTTLAMTEFYRYRVLLYAGEGQRDFEQVAVYQ